MIALTAQIAHTAQIGHSLAFSGQLFIANVTLVVTACVILYNICEEKEHDVLIEQADQENMLVPEDEEDFVQACKRHPAEGKYVQDVLANFMYLHQHR
ncbi:UNVERIFIED_CONTAM: hypothetical protein K2H54_042380 [Gekko kuhli]